ncbi:hypothetical protein [Azoarcus sp. KH32C]|uniref:hypothetical protein n=1 Tax=Azoarcus sp. KH32C TaxID=748247 RepID=UPI0002385E8F|nr:hypothetical protein [Azoarcus sp. KH32C]BAL23442.1 hypothetical protein AZKH_1112 [Azoarcus sp. KH32C]
MDRGWIQFLLVVVPVLSLIGSWLALRTIAERHQRRSKGQADDFRAPKARSRTEKE